MAEAAGDEPSRATGRTRCVRLVKIAIVAVRRDHLDYIGQVEDSEGVWIGVSSAFCGAYSGRLEISRTPGGVEK